VRKRRLAAGETCDTLRADLPKTEERQEKQETENENTEKDCSRKKLKPVRRPRFDAQLISLNDQSLLSQTSLGFQKGYSKILKLRYENAIG